MKYDVVVALNTAGPCAITFAGGGIPVAGPKVQSVHTTVALGALAATPHRQLSAAATRAGEYAYGCTFHSAMKATLTVR